MKKSNYTDLILPNVLVIHKKKVKANKKFYTRTCKRCGNTYVTGMGMKYSKICIDCNQHPHRSVSLLNKMCLKAIK